MVMEHRHFAVTPIGVVHRPGVPDGAQSESGTYYDPFAESVIEIFPEWAEGLAQIEEFSHLVVVLFMDRAEVITPDDSLLRHPNGRMHLPQVGLFATRSPHRPNPLGLCYPKLLRREGRHLHVTGMDAWPGTPVLDVKGYYLRDEQRPDATAPDWLQTLWTESDGERGGDRPSREEQR
ncbi:MAG: tRNA (N6-threonylcarbamoyladenosine(37)-N6)-methyltransferase TrmO [Thermomicrobiales bacterium]